MMTVFLPTKTCRHVALVTVLHARCWMLILPSLELRKHVNSQNKCCCFLFFLIHMAHGFCEATWKNITQILQDKQNPQSVKIKRTQSTFSDTPFKETVQHFWGVSAAQINTPASLVWLQAKTNNWKEKEKDSPAVSIRFSEKGSIAGRQHFHPAINNHHEKRTLSS